MLQLGTIERGRGVIRRPAQFGNSVDTGAPRDSLGAQ